MTQKVAWPGEPTTFDVRLRQRPRARLASSCSLAMLAVATLALAEVAHAQSTVDGCSEQSYLDRAAPDADRTFAWNYSFATDPERCITVRVGQVVTWQGNFGDHPLEADEGNRPNPIDEHVAGVVRFDQPGIYGYRCNYHLEMRGAVRVLPATHEVAWSHARGTAGLAALMFVLGLWSARRAHARQHDCRAGASNSSWP